MRNPSADLRVDLGLGQPGQHDQEPEPGLPGGVDTRPDHRGRLDHQGAVGAAKARSGSDQLREGGQLLADHGIAEHDQVHETHELAQLAEEVRPRRDRQVADVRRGGPRPHADPQRPAQPPVGGRRHARMDGRVVRNRQVLELGGGRVREPGGAGQDECRRLGHQSRGHHDLLSDVHGRQQPAETWAAHRRPRDLVAHHASGEGSGQIVRHTASVPLNVPSARRSSTGVSERGG